MAHNAATFTLPWRAQMEILNSIEDALKKYPNSYVTFARMGDCMVCHERHDLRCGVCFGCQPNVDGEPIKGGHRLWQRDKPENTWYVGN